MTSLPARGTVRLVGLSLFFALGSFVWGYNIGVIAPIYVNTGFIKALHKPTAAQKGLITAIYYLGTWLSYLFISHPLSDRLGRRYAALIGTLVSAVGAAVEAGSHGKTAFASMIIGRIISGFGNAIISAAVPLYQSEIAPASRRGGLVVMNHIGMVSGLAVAFWAGYGASHWTNANGIHNGWRMVVALQFVPSLFFVCGLPFVPDTPRWLLEQGRQDEALKTLQYLRGYENNPEAVGEEMAEITHSIEMNTSIAESSWSTLFTDRYMFARLWRGALLQFMAQMCGATAIKYYLPTVFTALGLSKDLSLMASGIESTLKIGCTIIEMLIIDRLGRRNSLLLGSTIMSVAMVVNGALPLAYPNNKNRASDYACVVFIFIFSFGYSAGFGPNSWVYGTEIFPTHIRAKGINICASAGAIGSIIVGQFYPVALQNIGAKTYFIFFAINIASFFVIFKFYPETKGKTLEELDGLFGTLLTDPERNGNGTKLREEEADGAVEQQVVANSLKL